MHTSANILPDADFMLKTWTSGLGCHVMAEVIAWLLVQTSSQLDSCTLSYKFYDHFLLLCWFSRGRIHCIKNISSRSLHVNMLRIISPHQDNIFS